MRRLAEHGPCPVCGTHPGSMGVTFFQREDGAARFPRTVRLREDRLRGRF